MVAIAKSKPKKSPKIDTALLKEMIDGVPIYYKGYEEIINGSKTIEDIMGSSSLQAILVAYLVTALSVKINRKLYWVTTNEVGANLAKNTNLQFDVAIFEKSKLPPSKVNKKYAPVAPFIVLELDTDIEFGEGATNTHAYVTKKTKKLLEFGTTKVIWIFTATQQIMVATKNEDWMTFDWNRKVVVLDDISFNIAEYLDEEGITVKEEA
jgi:Uma2 family endonuclease